MQSTTKHHAIGAVVAAAVACASAYGVHRAYPPIVQVMSHSGKLLPAAWPEMSQAEVDALTAELKKMPPHEVAIFCANRQCEDLALDFDNAFESAHWKSGIENPLVDTNDGINVAPNDARGRALAGAIARATGGRLTPGLIDAHMIGDRLAIVISRKSK